MPFWESPEQKNRREEQEATQQLLKSGQIPDHAKHRLEAQRNSKHKLFTSDLTCNESLLAVQAGYEPLGLVMGTSFYKVRFWDFFNSYRTTTEELSALSHAQLTAQKLAISRLRQEAAILGSHGVIGVRLKMSGYDWNSRSVEFTAIGTAIRIPDRQPDPQPFTSDLSGQEFWQLYKAGYYPKGIVLGVCSYYIHTNWNTSSFTRGGFFGRGSSQNQEITQYTQGVNLARHLALERLRESIRQHQAEGAIGMHIDTQIEDIEYERNNVAYHDLLVHFRVLGTAIIRNPEPVDTLRKTPLVYYNLATRQSSQIP